MLIYILISLMALCCLVLSLLYGKKNKTFYFILTIFLILVSGLRYNVGNDYETYKFSFINDYTENFELGFKFIIFILKFLGFNYQMMFLIVSFFTILFFSYAFYKYSKFPILALFIFVLIPLFYLSSFNVIRQFLAVSIFLLALKFLIESSFLKYSILLLLSSLFHKSALIFIPFYFIFLINPSFKVYLVICTTYFLSIYFILKLILKLQIFSQIYLISFFNKEIDVLKLAIFSFLFIIIFLMKDYILKQAKYNKIFINMFFFSILFLYTPLIENIDAEGFLRISLYGTVSLPILLSNIFCILRNYIIKFIYLITIILFAFLYYYLTLINNGKSVYLIPFYFNLNIF